LALLAVAALAGLAVWPSLPGELAIHFDASGSPNNYVSKPVGVFLAPAIGVATVAFVRYVPRFDPRPTDERVLDVTVVFLGALIAYVQATVLAWNLGYRFDIAVVLGPVFAATALLVAYAFHREGLGFR
jgi:uncharacterized membrane protein